MSYTVLTNPIDAIYGGVNKSFVPRGGFQEIGLAGRNPPLFAPLSKALKRIKTPMQAARIFIGFNVDDVPTLNMEQIIRYVFDKRYKQVEHAIASGAAKHPRTGGDIGASFILQRGIWQDLLKYGTTEPDTEPHVEDSAQIIILNTIEEDPNWFRTDMEAIASHLAVDFKQGAVIVEHQSKGKVGATVTYSGR